jgi:hypothetical protein
MFFKARFNTPLDESILEDFDLDLDYDSVIGKEIVLFKNHQFEIERDNLGFISEITYCNQCVQTYDIEEVFIELLQNLLSGDNTVALVDSEGLEDELTKDDLSALL